MAKTFCRIVAVLEMNGKMSFDMLNNVWKETADDSDISHSWAIKYALVHICCAAVGVGISFPVRLFREWLGTVSILE